MKVSIVVPIYNVEPFVGDCVRSIMRQTYEGCLECVLVDDCGSDRSMDVVERLVGDYHGKIEFKIVHHEHNQGLSVARNTGIDASDGDYVFFLDSDDWISDDCIAKLANGLSEENIDIVVGEYKTVGAVACDLELSLDDGLYKEKAITNTFCDNGVYVMAWNKLYRREFLLKNHLRFEPGRIHEDEILAFDLSCVNKTFMIVRSVTYFYRIRESSITMHNDIKRRLDGYIGILVSVKSRVGRYNRVKGIYDYYLFWVRRVFGMISRLSLDNSLLNYAEKATSQFLDVVPNMKCLEDTHNRLLYYACRKNQTFSRFQYVTRVYERQLQGKLVRHLLKLVPSC